MSPHSIADVDAVDLVPLVTLHKNGKVKLDWEASFAGCFDEYSNPVPNIRYVPPWGLALQNKIKLVVEEPGWTKVSDDRVRHIWIDDSGEEHAVPPWFYADAGTPIDEESGNDMTYSHTEVT